MEDEDRQFGDAARLIKGQHGQAHRGIAAIVAAEVRERCRLSIHSDRQSARSMAGLGIISETDTVALANGNQEERVMTRHASGTFEVKVKPLPADEKVAGLTVGRLALDKQFAGDLEGTSKGEMMTAETSVEGSGGYVAIERIDGTLGGRKGTFVLLHQATMKRGGDFKMTIVVVPDSGTGQLVGLTGTLVIIIKDGKHSYEFDHTLPDAA